MAIELSHEPYPVLRPCHTDGEEIAWLSSSDLAAAARLGAGAALLAMPDPWRERLLDRIAWYRTRHPPSAQSRLLAQMTDFLPGGLDDGDPEAFLFRWNRHHLAYELLVLEAALGLPMRLPVELRGADLVRAALTRGRGLVCWAMPFLYGPVIGAYAAWRAGFPAVGLSRWTHGYSTTRFGARLLNPVRVRAENRFLAGRIVIGRGHAPLSALRSLLRALRSNRPVTILLAPLADRLVEVPFAGGTMRAPVGPVRLAERAGCPVMPIYTWRENGRFVVELDPPLPSVSDAGGAASVVAELARRLEPRVRRLPEQFHWLHPSFLPPGPPEVRDPVIREERGGR